MISKRAQIAVFIVTVGLAALLGMILSWVFITNHTQGRYPFNIPPGFLPDIELFMALKMVVSFVDIALIILTLAIYVNIYRRIKSKFTTGLILMLLVLLMHAPTSIPLFQFGFGYPIIGMGMLSILPDIFTMIALVVLFYLSLE